MPQKPFKVETNQKAPEISLPNQDGTVINLSDFLGQWVLVYFYPKDDTPGCTKEACEIRDNFPKFSDLKIEVLGISTDSVKSHKKFVDKYNLPFNLLADEEKAVVNEYGVWQEKKFMGKTFMGTVRSSFLINPQGEIAKVYEKVKPKEHADEVLNDVNSLS